MSSAWSSVLDTRGTLVEGIGVPERQPREPPEPVVGLEQLAGVADVAPVPADPPAVDRHASHEPGDEPPGLVRHVPFVEVATDQRHMRTVVDVRRGGGERRLRLLGLLDERDNTLALVQLDDPVLPRELATADVVDGDGARLPPPLPPADEVREARVEEVVAAQHQ